MLKNEGIDIWVRPETTGKPTQFGDMNEILKLVNKYPELGKINDKYMSQFSHLKYQREKNENR